MVFIDDSRDALEDSSQAEIGILHLAQVDNSHGHHGSFITSDAQQTVSHHVGSWVNAKDDLLRFQLFCHLSVEIGI